MNYHTIQPSKELAKYVRYFWVHEGSASISKTYVHRSMADGCVELLFHYKGQFDELDGDLVEKSFVSGIHGQSNKLRRFRINQNFGIFGAYLYPSAIPELFLMPATELTNQMPDLCGLLSKTGRELEEKMMLASNNQQRVKIITTFLVHKLRRSKPLPSGMFETMQYILHTHGKAKVEHLADRNFLSLRQFERNFKHCTGFSPKIFSRIARFQFALDHYENKGRSLTQIAYDCGYFDQSHFIQEFKTFSGHRPKEYFSGLTESTVWKD
ncbi:MAG: AraC family transcriptional regulator [Cyclobacteriaceae bacterium]